MEISACNFGQKGHQTQGQIHDGTKNSGKMNRKAKVYKGRGLVSRSQTAFSLLYSEFPSPSSKLMQKKAGKAVWVRETSRGPRFRGFKSAIHSNSLFTHFLWACCPTACAYLTRYRSSWSRLARLSFYPGELSMIPLHEISKNASLGSRENNRH